jgi:ribonuclease HII
MNTELYKRFREFATKNIEKSENLQKLINDDYPFSKTNNKDKKNKIYRNIRNKKDPLRPYYNGYIDEIKNGGDDETNNPGIIIERNIRGDSKILLEAGIDESGRGPMFGRVYVACVILPRDNFNFSLMKDSKRFSSNKKITEAYNYIIENCIDYSISYMDEKDIDKINIREATLSCMHECIETIEIKPEFLLIDGCDFREYKGIPYECIEGGDNWYCSIAAASILAKVSRDKYIEKICEDNPELDEKYGLLKNKGYGTKKHIDGLKKYGLTQWHRKTFGICKTL